MYRGTIISLCDLTGIMVKPWVESGYRAVLVDPQHKEQSIQGGVERLPFTILDAMPRLSEIIKNENVVFVFGFPPCTDVAVSGAAHFESKRQRDPHFQAKAALVAEQCRMIGMACGCPWGFENPVSVFSGIFGKPDAIFHPFEYGGYLPEGVSHPLHPDYFPPQDAYGKKTCLWVGGGFVMPEKRPVPIATGQVDGQGQSKAHNKLGGKSDRTKNIRSATPRGFAKAVFLANAPHLKEKYKSA